MVIRIARMHEITTDERETTLTRGTYARTHMQRITQDKEKP